MISPLTAKTHVSRIRGKLGCRDRAQLVALAYETGLVAQQLPIADDRQKARPISLAHQAASLG